MFLNDFGQPLILDPHKNYGPYEEHIGPLLLTAAALKGHVRVNNWSGTIIGSEADVLQMQTTLPEVFTKDYEYSILEPNKTTEIIYKNNTFKFTLLPIGANPPGVNSKIPRLYYLENGYTKSIIADDVPASLDFISKSNATFHRGLRNGIDVMYLVDPVAELDKEDAYALVQVIRPKHIYGVRQGNLSKWLLDLCVRRDLYARVT